MKERDNSKIHISSNFILLSHICRENDEINNCLFNTIIPNTDVTYSTYRTGFDRSLKFQRLRLPIFINTRHIKVITLSAPRTSRLYTEPELTPEPQ